MGSKVSYKLVSAVIRTECFETVEKALHEVGIKGMTAYQVRGFGRYAPFFQSDWTVTHVKLEVFVRSARAAFVADAIRASSVVTMPGDGVVAVLPVESFEHIHQPVPEG